MGKSNQNNDMYLTLFVFGILGFVFTVFGSIFVYVGLTQEVASEPGVDGKLMFVIMGSAFAAIGILFVILALINFKGIREYKKLLADPSMYQTKATYIKKRIYGSSTTSVDVSDSADVFYKVYYSYRDEVGVEHTVQSVMSYTKEQAEHLKSIKTFTIRCKGKRSAIIEEMPQARDLFNI